MQQVRAAAQSLAGLGARVFNWSLSSALQETERIGLWELALMYLEPCVHIDERIADSCRGLKAALGHLPGIRKQEAAEAVPGGGSSEETGHRTLALEQALTNAMLPPAAAIAGGAPSAGFPSSRDTGREPRLGRSSPRRAREEEPVDEVVVTFTASHEARKLNGSYVRRPGVLMNGRAVYLRGREHLVYVDDGTWVIKEGASGEAGAYVYAYCEDASPEPFLARSPWHVMDDADGFVADQRARVVPGPRRLGAGD
mmetsp:Transcript_99050/g.288931  ORF Transcript_99050/g.288931 Transcript_99050/m.288931 type:complete len:255 (+) Transcript_99050:59-823(+)